MHFIQNKQIHKHSFIGQHSTGFKEINEESFCSWVTTKRERETFVKLFYHNLTIIFA